MKTLAKLQKSQRNLSQRLDVLEGRQDDVDGASGQLAISVCGLLRALIEVGAITEEDFDAARAAEVEAMTGQGGDGEEAQEAPPPEPEDEHPAGASLFGGA